MEAMKSPQKGRTRQSVNVPRPRSAAEREAQMKMMRKKRKTRY